MSPKKEGGAAPAAQGKKKSKGRIERINGRFVWFQQWAEGVAKTLAAASAATSPAPLQKDVSDTADLVKTIAEACAGVSEKLLALHKQKWEPKASGKDVFVVGSPVMMKPRHVDKLAGVYEKSDLFSLRVVSLHGKMAKVEIFKDNLAGEKFAVPCYQLQARKEQAAK